MHFDELIVSKVAPGDDEKEPAMQIWHVDDVRAPESVAYVPALHGWHPLTLAYCPVRQEMAFCGRPFVHGIEEPTPVA